MNRGRSTLVLFALLQFGCSNKAEAPPAPDAGLAVEACKRACTTLAGCGGQTADNCAKNTCLDPTLPSLCISDTELANAWDQCAKATCAATQPACGDEAWKSARAHCLGRFDAGSGLYCGNTGGSGSGTDCTLTATCEGKSYEMVCTAGTCTCKVDGATVKTYPRVTSSCTGQGSSSDWATKCGFPYP